MFRRRSAASAAALSSTTSHFFASAPAVSSSVLSLSSSSSAPAASASASASAHSIEQRRFCASAAPQQQQQQQTTTTTQRHPFLTFNETLVLSQVDYCAVLGKEAHAKHGVPANVPPQANPPTDRHQVVYCDILAKRVLDPASSFCYPIIFESPPKETPGMELPRADSAAAAAVSHAQLRGHHGQPAPKPGTPGAVAAAIKRRPIDNGKFENPLKELMASMYGDEFVGSSGGAAARSGAAAGGLQRNVRFNLPTDEEIDTLLLETWDSVAEQRTTSSSGDLRGAAGEYTPCAKFIVLTSDNPDAPPTLQVSEELLRSLDGSAATGGAASSSPEMLQHFRTPFTSDPSIAARGLKPPTLSKHLERKFVCGECEKPFRIFNALETHYQTAHGKPMPERLRLQYKAADMGGEIAQQVQELERRKRELEEKVAAAASAAAATEAAAATAQQQQQQSAVDAAAAAAAAASSSTIGSILVGEAALRAAPLPEVDISVHARAGPNMELVGVVRSVRCGYVRSDFVAELLVETAHAYTDGGAEEKELHLVRCFGEEYAKAVAAQVAGQDRRVMVVGVLKTNKHRDKATSNVTAFPYVRVSAPLGMVQALD